jgi:hypothetical protein
MTAAARAAGRLRVAWHDCHFVSSVGDEKRHLEPQTSSFPLWLKPAQLDTFLLPRPRHRRDTYTPDERVLTTWLLQRNVGPAAVREHAVVYEGALSSGVGDGQSRREQQSGGGDCPQIVRLPRHVERP